MIIVESDWSFLEGSGCYCSPQAADRIRRGIAGLPLNAIHMIGTGDCHYQTLFWLERIREPFGLILFDNHPDNQESAFGGDMLSCGGWVSRALELPFLKSFCWIDGEGRVNGGLPPEDLPVYLSVDIDILSRDCARTNWDQGSVSLDELCSRISGIAGKYRILGADICGGLSPSKGGTVEDAALNSETVSAITECLAG